MHIWSVNLIAFKVAVMDVLPSMMNELIPEAWSSFPSS